jgi:polysaccharide deacetylase family protein (PEP-CTERM system associated)
MINGFSIDVEDYWKILSCDWLGKDMKPTEAVLRNTKKILSILDEYNVKATFFVLGEVAEKFPNLVREINELGHEVGAHGYHHCVIYTINREIFEKEVTDAKKLIEDILGQRVLGHRAPSFSIMPSTHWALDVLSNAGYNYDSSIFPFAGNRYGWPGFSKDICELKLDNGKIIVEVPMSTISLFGKSLPACGGGYLRHFPYLYTQLAMKRMQRKRPAIIYLHPYDLDIEKGTEEIEIKLRTTAPRRSKIRHKIQLHCRHTMESKLKRLLNTYNFAPICDVIAAKKHIETYETSQILQD